MTVVGCKGGFEAVCKQLDGLALCAGRAGADSMITPREVIREYITVLDVMLQNPQADYYEIVGARPQLVSDASKEQEEDRFTLKDFEI